MADPNLESGFFSVTGGGGAVERDLDAVGGDGSELDGLAGEPDPRQIDFGGLDLGADARALESNAVEVETRGDESPGEVVDGQIESRCSATAWIHSRASRRVGPALSSILPMRASNRNAATIASTAMIVRLR